MSAATRDRLARLLEDETFDLAEANLLIAAEGSRGLDMAGALAHVEGLAQLARTGGVVATLRDQGFRGDPVTYDDPRNSFLNEVLDRRRGLPIALATLTLALARRVGARMAGVGMPGHFIVADLSGPEPVYIDAFGDWERLDVGDCARLVARTTGLAFRSDHLAPVSDRAIVMRTLANLRGSYLRRRSLADALWVTELALIVAPGEPTLALDAVALLSGLGRYEDAEAAASAHLAARPDDPDAGVFRELIAASRRMRGRMN
ncbi:MAG: transglutaminase family protein [Thermoleophilia bacterium]